MREKGKQMGKYETKLDAANAWINEWNATPSYLIKAAMQLNPEEWTISGFYYNEETDEEEYIEDGCYLELPCWNTLWTPDFLIDEEWILENKKAICELGFRIIENTKEYTGTWLGIEGYGYSFMQEHFLPLYELRGLEWHKA